MTDITKMRPSRVLARMRAGEVAVCAKLIILATPKTRAKPRAKSAYTLPATKPFTSIVSIMQTLQHNGASPRGLAPVRQGYF